MRLMSFIHKESIRQFDGKEQNISAKSFFSVFTETASDRCSLSKTELPLSIGCLEKFVSCSRWCILTYFYKILKTICTLRSRDAAILNMPSMM